MSSSYSDIGDTNTNSGEDCDESFIEQHREKIEREAESDAPDAWVFQRLLESSGGEST